MATIGDQPQASYPTGEWWRPTWSPPVELVSTGFTPGLSDEQASWLAAAIALAGRKDAPKVLARAIAECAAEIRRRT